MSSVASLGSGVSASALARRCKQVIASEMALYDSLSRVSRLRYERAVERAIEDDCFSRFECSHSVKLYEVCTKCERNEADARIYARVAELRLRELLRILESQEVSE